MVPTILIMDEINEGNRLFLEKKFQDAIKKYNIILEKEPDNLIALENKGYSLSKLKKYSDEEILSFLASVEQYSNHPYANQQKKVVYFLKRFPLL